MSGSSLQSLLEELKRSPGKAVVLLIGAVGAAVVWGPRLASGFSTGSRAEQPSLSATEDEAAAAGIERRDPGNIREEFIKISEDARRLRVLAEPVEMLVPEFDPYAASEYRPKVVETNQVPELEQDEQNERSVAETLRLTGVFEFKSGRSAVLAGNVLREGDLLTGLVVESIEPRAVVLRGRFGLYRVQLDRQEEKR